MSGRLRARVGWWLRRLADRIDYRGAPRYTGYSFTFETGEGIRVRGDKRGCPIAYLGEADYARAHAEADTRTGFDGSVSRAARIAFGWPEQGGKRDA